MFTVLNANHQLEGMLIQDDHAKKNWEVLEALSFKRIIITRTIQYRRI